MRGRKALRRDEGAAAVEFALVSVLFTILFGILQYGILLWQVQAATATVQDAARRTARGLDLPSCTQANLRAAFDLIGQSNGLPANAVQHASVVWGVSGATAQRNGTATITLVVAPTQIGLPFVPVPADLRPNASTLVEGVGKCTAEIL
jgi:Flp pilus assembly protein TadG